MAKQQTTTDLSIKDCLRLFNVSDMTFFNWRSGRTASSRPKVPEKQVKVGERHRVTFPKDKLAAWAKKNGVEMDKKVAKELGITLQ